MSQEQAAGEKNFAPTEKRKKDAANNGDVLRSKELATASAMMVGGAWLLWAGSWLLESLRTALSVGLTWERADLVNFDPSGAMMALLASILPPVMVLGVAVITSSIISQMGFGTGVWVNKNLTFKGSRLNPLNGIKRMFGPNGLIEMIKGLGKVLLLGVIAWAWGSSHYHGFASLGRGNLSEQLAFAWDSLISLIFSLGAGLFLIALIDVPVQMFRRNKRLMMSLQEVRDETKESEGSPEQKGAIRDRQRKMAAGALAPAMKEAQFVVTNPTHFSVALCYDPAKADAPILVAKGRDDKALAIRDLAGEYDLPVLEFPQLARALFFTTQERQVIRHELYASVAALLAFVLQLKRGETPQKPKIEVPVELHFDADGTPSIRHP
ncbi:EscU/YscU/HrcU family type III secretion system export apparatus switch protein [Croceicoccus gelatinilyticus]|uniref:EscU/YscU/HrcU family type III secretion system export apparatus switch protein n=1 Tax=Croceicoccus gelatinilyticus TaxID=2835536 RepID=UPI001BCF8163|nr:EscU/YscU/HrcU family type III secretion system export apparatus switch protein [Croceicoccus gelatinilyticus]MBS7671343.1 EscU/YscU/HrcU family type III secretion system export apparatus switch protein [Croceicoccus gelatinilyticus]